MSQTVYRALVALLTATFAALGLGWALLTPAFHAPDEPQHLNSVLRVLRGEGWPAPGTAYLTVGTMQAAREAGFSAGYGSMVTGTPVPRDERSVVSTSGDPFPDEVSPSYDQMTQHPPAYYALGAGVLVALGEREATWNDQLLSLRLLGVALTLWVVPLAAASAVMLTGSRHLGVAAAAVPLAVPQFAHISATVTNDTLTTLSIATVTYLALRAMTRGGSWPLAVATGAALGIGLMSKGFALAAVPVAALALIVPPSVAARPTRRSRVWHGALAMLVAFAVGGWWWLRNLLLFGTIQPSGAPQMLPDATSPVTTSPVAFLPAAAARLNQSFWGNFGWLDLALPRTAVKIALLVLVLAAASAAVWAWQQRRATALGVLWLLPVGTVAIVVAGAYAAHLRTGLYPGLQGRYLFGAMVVIGVTVAAALGLVPERFRRALPALAVWGAFVVAGAALVFAHRGMYQPAGAPFVEAWDRWMGWSLVDEPVVVTSLAVLVTVALTTGVLVLLPGRPTTAEGRDETVGPGTTTQDPS